MAIYHASFQIISRSAGRSACACSAYRSGERVVDRTTGESFYFAAKQSQSVSDAFILAPDHAPSWVHDRSALWSAVEAVERRKDAQLSRELNVALPVELSVEQQRDLIESYVQSAFVDRGMVADVALHDLSSGNPHAHVMLTMRDVGEEGFGKKNRLWNDRSLLQEWRSEWSAEANQALEQAGHDIEIDHRSLADQGIERIPTVHLGYRAHRMEQRGIETERGDLNRMIERVNRELGFVVEQAHTLGRRLKAGFETVRASVLERMERTFGLEPVTGLEPLSGMEPALAGSSGTGDRPDTEAGLALLEALKTDKAEEEALEQARQDEVQEQQKSLQQELGHHQEMDRGMGR